MEDMKIFLTMLGVVFGGVIAWIVYLNIGNNMAKNCKNIAKKAEILLKKDMSSKYARCTFYINNDYDNEYSQSEWLDYYKECTEGLDKDSKEYTEAVAPFINAIVVSNIGHYIRRGCEFNENTREVFVPGRNDRISLNYFVEPYKYVKNEVRRTSSTQTRTTVSHNSSSDRLASYERDEIERAKKKYEKIAHYVATGRLPSVYNEASEKSAYAEYMRVLAKYAGKK